MFGQDSQDQQQSNDQSSFAPPGMAPVIDHSLPVPTPASGGMQDFGAPAPTAPPADITAGTPGPVAVPDHTQPQGPVNDELINIKQDALQQLSPLVGHLEQSPEEKFRTTMMMIQASDDQSLIRTAYEAAQAITDEKARAQALLDVVNEINYFTQQQPK
jgi:hypothetical protein